MTHCIFESGGRLKIDKSPYQLRRLLPDERWQLENERDGELITKSKSELLELYDEKRLIFNVTISGDGDDIDEAVNEKIQKDFSDYPEKLRKTAQKRLRYVQAINYISTGDHAKTLAQVAKLVGDQVPPVLTTVREWVQRYKQSSNNIVSLIPDYCKCGNRNARYPDKVIELATIVLRKMHLSTQRTSKEETLSALRDMIVKENRALPEDKKLPKPGRKFLRIMIAAVSEYDRIFLQYGKLAADRHFRECLKSGEPDYAPLSRVEIDHTSLDVMVVDPKTYLPLGRPTISVALDRRTRCVLGFHVSFEPPNYIQVMKCLKHAIMPKEYIRSKYPQIENPWPCWGIPQELVVDNGREFHSKDLEEAAITLLMTIRYGPVAKPWWKGAVERWFGTLSRSLIHTLPGTTFSNVIEKSTYDSMKNAVVTLDVLDELLHTWICDVYHQTAHRSTLRSPANLWRELIDPTKQYLPPSADVLEVSLCSVESRTVFHYGINMNNLTYNSPELQMIRRHKGNISVTIRWDRSDLGQIYVLDEISNCYLNVPCKWFSYASGVSLWLHNAIRREAERLEGTDSETEARLDAAKARLRDICLKAMTSKRLKTRKTAARAEKGLKSSQSEIVVEGPPIKKTPAEADLTLNDPTAISSWDSDEDEVASFEITERSLNN